MDNFEFRFVTNQTSLERLILAIDAEIGRVVDAKMRNGGLTDEHSNPESDLQTLKELRTKFKNMYAERYPQRINFNQK